MYEDLKITPDLNMEQISVNENISMVQVGSETNRSPRDQRNTIFDDIIGVRTGLI
jgi:hypothetical protein